jgi:methionyl-tRNA synthetase
VFTEFFLPSREMKKIHGVGKEIVPFHGMRMGMAHPKF